MLAAACGLTLVRETSPLLHPVAHSSLLSLLADFSFHH